MSSKVDNLYVGLKKVVTDRIEEKMASNGHLSADALGRRMDEFHNSWEISLDIKLSDFNQILTSILDSYGLPGSNVSVGAAEQNTDTAPRIEGCYSVYMYDGKMDMHVPAYFDLPGNTKFFNAWKLWLNGNSGYSCTDLGEETITAPIRPFMNFTVDSIREKLWKNFDT